MAEAAEHRGRVTKNAVVLMVLTLASRIAGLVRDSSITHYFGASGQTDIFYMAFTIPNVLRRLVAEGTLTVTFQPAYQKVRADKGEEAARHFFAAITGFVLVAVTAIVVVGILASGLLVLAFAAGFSAEPGKFEATVELTRWLFPVVVFISLVALSMAVLNAHDVYGSPALAPVVMNLSMIAFTIIGATTFSRPIMGVVVGVLVGGVLQLAVQIPPLVKRGLLERPSFRWNSPDVRSVLYGFLPGLFALAVYQVNIVVLRRLASYLPEGSVSYYYNADRIMELTNGVFAIAIAQGAFTLMNELAAKKDFPGLIGLWRFSFKLQNMIAIPAAIGLAALAEPIIAVLFLHGQFTWDDTKQTAVNVMCAAPGLVAAATVRGTAQMFYSLEDRRTPVYVSVVVVIANLMIGWMSMTLGFGIAGLSATLAIANWIQATLLVVLLRRKLGALGMPGVLGAGALKLMLGAAAGAAAWAVSRLGDWQQGPSIKNVGVLALAIVVAVVIYGVGAFVMRFEGVDIIANKITNKLRRLRRAVH